MDMEEVISIQGPVEKLEGNLTLLIPLDAGGDQLVECSRGIGVVEGEHLKVMIPQWLADKLLIVEGDLVSVSNADGKFNIHPVNPRRIL